MLFAAFVYSWLRLLLDLADVSCESATRRRNCFSSGTSFASCAARSRGRS